MRVLLIHHGTILGGAPISLMLLVKELECDEEIEPIVVSHAVAMRQFFSKNLQRTWVEDWVDPLTLFGKIALGLTPLRFVNVWQFLTSLFRLPSSVAKQVNRIRIYNPHIVHLNSSVLISSAVAAKLLGIPIVWHDREPLQGSELNVRFWGWFIRTLADKVIAISPEEAKRLGVGKHDKVQLIYNPIDFNTLKPDQYYPLEEKMKLGFGKGDKIVLNLGGMNPRKGTCELIEAMRFTDEHTKLVIAGPILYQGEYYLRIKHILEGYAQDKVIFTGMVEHVAPLIAACDILAFIGTKPHFPRPVFEAWAMKKPVIVNDMEGIGNNIEHGVDGIVVDELFAEVLGKAIQILLQDEPLMHSMGERGYLKAQALCAPENHARSVNAIYTEVMKGAKK